MMPKCQQEVVIGKITCNLLTMYYQKGRDVRFQTLGQKQRCLFNTSKQTWWPGSPCNSLLPICYRILLADTPHPSPKLLQPRMLGCSSLYSLTILVVYFFCTSGLLAAGPGSHLSPLPSPFSLPTQPSSGSCTIWTLPEGLVSGYAFLHNYNKLLPLPYL